MNDCKWAKTCCYDVCAPDYCPEYEEAVLTNGDRIRAMSDEELSDFLIQVAYAGADPWGIPFERKFCDNCPTVECTIQETGQTMDFHECDFADGKCPHGTDVIWWLKQPAEVE